MSWGLFKNNFKDAFPLRLWYLDYVILIVGLLELISFEEGQNVFVCYADSFLISHIPLHLPLKVLHKWTNQWKIHLPIHQQTEGSSPWNTNRLGTSKCSTAFARCLFLLLSSKASFLPFSWAVRQGFAGLLDLRHGRLPGRSRRGLRYS